jgi:SpoVK/Ycf46/Vps4 family AAA+-type ATPase
MIRRRKFNNTVLEGKQLCYILEDCDAFDNNIIQNRTKNENLENEKSENEDTKNSELNELLQVTKLMNFSNNIDPKNKKNDEDNINLSCFLNILDGIIELHGIMIIMTTNHPEKIDCALIRPGRFDFKHEFKRASKKIIKEMLKFKYMVSDEEINLLTDNLIIKDDILSPADIQSICFKNDNISDCINEIMESMK